MPNTTIFKKTKFEIANDMYKFAFMVKCQKMTLINNKLGENKKSDAEILFETKKYLQNIKDL